MKHLYIIILSISLLLLSGCESMLDMTNPNKVTNETFWKTENDFKEALTSCYTPLKVWSGGYYGTRGVMLQLSRGDDLIFRVDLTEVYQLHRFTNDPSNGVISNIFYQFYNAIYRSTSILQEIKGKDFSKEFVNETRGEALFIRGLCFFQLGKEFGDVPLRLTASQDPSTFQLANSSQAEVYAQAETDLKEAAALLPVKNEPGKPTSGSAYAFLGKMYVYQEKWQQAKEILEPLTKSPYEYKLVDDYTWNFDEEHEGNSESIFEILYEPVGGSDQWDNGETANSSQSTTMAVEYASGSVGGWFEANPTQQMMDIFMKEKSLNGSYDKRLLSSVAWNYPGCFYYMKPIQDVLTPTELNKYWIIKYSHSTSREREVETEPSYINHRAMRYADVLLLLAECNLHINENTNKAIEYINQIRTRGGNLSTYSGSNDIASVKEELIRQRAIEFFREGERFYDLRRWGLLEQKLKEQDPSRLANFNKRHYYLPIPSKEIQTNLLCKQHEGW